MRLEQRVETEITELHAFFEHWFSGQFKERDDVFQRVENALHPDFEIITPKGDRLDQSEILDSIRAGFDAHSELSIDLKNIELFHVGSDVAVATFEEWQTEPPEGPTGRLSTVVFTLDDDGPNGLRWLHLQETWL